MEKQDTMKAVYMEDSKTLKYGDLPIPKLKKGQVLIKVEAAPLNPSDVYFMQGLYGDIVKMNYPLSPGWEGAGTVVATGGGFLAWLVKGKRVAFTKADEGKDAEKNGFCLGGAYAEYCVTNGY